MDKINIKKFVINEIKPYFKKYKEIDETVLKTDKKQNVYLLHGETVLMFTASDDTKSFHITHAIPPAYGYQVPILLEIRKDGSDKILSFQILDDMYPPNKTLHFKIAPMKKGEISTIHFDYWVLVKNNDFNDLPKYINIPVEDELPKDTKRWLTPTNTIQSNNILIKLVALFLKGLGTDLIKLGERIVFFSCYHRPFLAFLRYNIEASPILHKLFLPKRYWTGLMDAVSYLFFGGLCIGKANFEAALFRANHIPARVLITTTLYYGKELWCDAQHCIVEFYCPNYGWVPAMSGRIPYQPKNYIILRVVYPRDENIAGHGLSYYGGSVPWFWISSEKIELSFPNKLINYGYKNGPGVPANRGWSEKRIKVDEKVANKAFDLSKKVWKSYLQYSNKNNKNKMKSVIKNARLEQKKAVQYFNQSNVYKYMEHIKNALRIYEKIKEGN